MLGRKRKGDEPQAEQVGMDAPPVMENADVTCETCGLVYRAAGEWEARCPNNNCPRHDGA
jgi:hypothetical protein